MRAIETTPKPKSRTYQLEVDHSEMTTLIISLKKQMDNSMVGTEEWKAANTLYQSLVDISRG